MDIPVKKAVSRELDKKYRKKQFRVFAINYEGKQITSLEDR
jgi:hypothetical protein